MAIKWRHDELVGVFKIHTYHPFKRDGEKNPYFNADSKRILNFKNPDNREHNSALKYYKDSIAHSLTLIDLKLRPVIGAYVPSHEANKVSAGLDNVLKHSATTHIDFSYTANPLLRHSTVPKLATGGDRSVAVHLASIQVDQVIDLNGALVVLIDDVCTSGHSLEACETLLLRAGAHRVWKIAFGRTA